MKNLIIKAIIIAIITVAVPITLYSCSMVSGGIIHQSRSIDLSGVTKIVADRAVKVEIVDTESEDIEIDINKDLLEYLVLKVDGERLTVAMHYSVERLKIRGSWIDIRVRIPYNKLYSSFEVSAASSIISSVDIVATEAWISADAASYIELKAVVARDCHVEVGSASSIDLIATVGGVCNIEVRAASNADLTINAEELNASLDGYSKIEVQGRVKRLNVEAESCTSFNGSSLSSESGKLSAEGMSKISYRGSGEFSQICEGLSKIKNVAN